MNRINDTLRGALGGARRHPVRAAAICVPLLAVSVFAGSTMASASSGAAPTLAVSAAELNAAPAQHVLYVGNQTAGQVVRGKPASTAPKETWNIDGCDHDYGTANQCVPWKIPAVSPKADCAWLRASGFGPLKVTGTNRQHLPVTVVNGESYACE